MSLKAKKTDAWSLYHAMFKKGEEIIVVFEDDVFSWGKIIRATKTHLVLKRLGKKQERIDWDAIRFMAQDGFPAKRLLGADGSQLIEQIDTKKTQEAIRQSLSAVECPRCFEWVLPSDIKKVKYIGYSVRGERKSYLDEFREECSQCRNRKKTTRDRNFIGSPFIIVAGDPFIIENVNGILVNPGKIWTPDNWDYEETLLLQSKDGAQGMLWGLETCYHFET